MAVSSFVYINLISDESVEVAECRQAPDPVTVPALDVLKVLCHSPTLFVTAVNVTDFHSQNCLSVVQLSIRFSEVGSGERSWFYLLEREEKRQL